MRAELLAGASEILARLAVEIEKNATRAPSLECVSILFDKKYFGALQELFKGTEWHGHFSWYLTGGYQVMLSVNVAPKPVMMPCRECGGKGYKMVLP